MTRYYLVFGGVCLLLAGVALWQACPVQAWRAAQGWIDPALDLLVLVPAGFTAFILCIAAWRERANTGNDQLDRIIRGAGAALAGRSSHLPFVVLLALFLGISAQFVMLVSDLACTEAGVELDTASLQTGA